MAWVVGGVVVWFVLAFVASVVVGRGIRVADERDARPSSLTTADLPSDLVAAP
jgi:hypothetical protein